MQNQVIKIINIMIAIPPTAPPITAPKGNFFLVFWLAF